MFLIFHGDPFLEVTMHDLHGTRGHFRVQGLKVHYQPITGVSGRPELVHGVPSSISDAQANATVGLVEDEAMVRLNCMRHCLKALMEGQASKDTDSASLVLGLSSSAMVDTALLVSALRSLV